MFVLESILTDGIAQLSYLVADTEMGVAAVIDPRTKAWETAGFPLAKLEQMPVQELREQQQAGPAPIILDVRSPGEWETGRVPRSKHYFVANMRDRISGLDKDRHYVTYCASGYRASIASSLMKAPGFKNVSNVPGSWSVWTAAGFPVEGEKEANHA